jgi:hypothetical protein
VKEMIDPMVSLAFAVYSNRGVYALLLGSGVSRAAGIPTGWEVALDLIRKVAALQNADPRSEDELVSWYTKSQGEEPDYSKLLDRLASSRAERSQLLRGYFEPNEEEKEQRIKLPTEAHHAIARLVSQGYVSLILTSNFDRLTETALREEGIVPQVISTSDGIVGALPLRHSKCTVVKINGDYLDTRIRNTAAELTRYDEPMNRLLDQVFDEYGLIVCGWSGQSDIGLVSAIERCRSRRFSTFWATRGEVSEAGRRLIENRQGTVIPIKDADALFHELEEKVSCLAEIAARHPLSPRLAVAAVKRYIVDDHQIIRLHDLVTQEAETLYQRLIADEFSPAPSFAKEEPVSRVRRYEAYTEVLRNMLVAGSYWGKLSHCGLWQKVLRRIADARSTVQYTNVWTSLQNYPAVLLGYSVGIASVAAGKYDTLKTVLVDREVKFAETEEPLALRILPVFAMQPEDGRRLPGRSSEFTAANNQVQGALRESFREVLPSDAEYQATFDRFEYILSMIYADLDPRQRLRAPLGCFGWRAGIEQVIDTELRRGDAPDWAPLKAGLFGGSLERARQLHSVVNDEIKTSNWRF